MILLLAHSTDLDEFTKKLLGIMSNFSVWIHVERILITIAQYNNKVTSVLDKYMISLVKFTLQ